MLDHGYSTHVAKVGNVSTAELAQLDSIIGTQVAGRWRARTFVDLLEWEIDKYGGGDSPVLLDIGCGRGFDDSAGLQAKLAKRASAYIGVEPDIDISVPSAVGTCHRCLLEEAEINANSIDLAFSVMVLEHVLDPKTFWATVHRVLKPGGVCWGFTMDARHWFARASSAAASMGVKDWYLNRLRGSAGAERYINYPAVYRSNTPKVMGGVASEFTSCICWSVAWVGQLDFYVPRPLRPLAHLIDRAGIALEMPGSVLAVRVAK